MTLEHRSNGTAYCNEDQIVLGKLKIVSNVNSTIYYLVVTLSFTYLIIYNDLS